MRKFSDFVHVKEAGGEWPAQHTLPMQRPTLPMPQRPGLSGQQRHQMEEAIIRLLADAPEETLKRIHDMLQHSEPDVGA